MYLRNGRIGIIDLTTGESAAQQLAEDASWNGLSSIPLSNKLLAEHGPGSLILGTGALTASFVPASCAGTIVSANRLMPMLGHAGVELKLSGFDFIVVKGKAQQPGYIWARDGVLEFVGATDMRSANSWARTDRIRADQGDSKIQVVSAGPWCDAASEASQLVIDHWGGEDKVAMGAEFGKRNLLAVAFRGMGEVELAEPEKHFEDSILLMREHVLRLGNSQGLASYYEGANREDFTKLVHRSIACYGCPHPCRTYVKVEENPREMRWVAKEPGYLHYDVPALEKAYEMGLDSRLATSIMMSCAKAGAEPVAILSACAGSGREVTVDSIASFLAKPIPLNCAQAGNFERSLSGRKTYEQCLGLGLCPRYWSKVGFDLEAVSAYAESSLGFRLSGDL